MDARDILTAADELQPRLVAWRRQFHQHPELGMEEYETAAAVTAHLNDLGIEYRDRVGGTGVVGLIRGRGPGKTIAIRADMDALPIQEEGDRPYASRVPGKMHACGHDGHTAILLGAATLLAELRERFCGQVKLLFQPAEEGPGGAQPMIADGAMEDPHVDAVIGLHVNNDIDAGKMGIQRGVTSAAPDGFELTVRGAGGHGAHPEKAVDAIVVGAQVVTALQTIVSRESSAVEPLVITVGTFQGGFRGNVIAPEVRMTGTIRTLDPDLRAGVEDRMRRVVGGVCAAMRAGYELKYSYGYPSVINDDTICTLVASAARNLFGERGVVELEKPSMGGEDFAYFAEKAPACFFRLGGRNEAKGIVMPGHHPAFDFDEDCLKYGVAVFVRTALDYLGSQAGTET